MYNFYCVFVYATCAVKYTDVKREELLKKKSVRNQGRYFNTSWQNEVVI